MPGFSRWPEGTRRGGTLKLLKTWATVCRKSHQEAVVTVYKSGMEGPAKSPYRSLCDISQSIMHVCWLLHYACKQLQLAQARPSPTMHCILLVCMVGAVRVGCRGQHEVQHEGGLMCMIEGTRWVLVYLCNMISPSSLLRFVGVTPKLW